VSAVPDRLLREPAVRAVTEAARGLGEGWIVGGTIRDALLGRRVTDVDLAV
jgi:tRNA nucleotidyltransferase/poly(A) polymerase